MRKLNSNTHRNNEEVNFIQQEVKDIINKFGNLICATRKEKGIKLKDLSEKSGVSIGVISDLENGKDKIPNLYTLVALSRILQIPNDKFLSTIFGGIVETSKSPDLQLINALIAYGIPNDVASNILVGIDLAYGNHKLKRK